MGEQLFLTNRGFNYLLRAIRNITPKADADSIHEKGKLDGLSKFITSFQALWFCTNSLSRITQGLPLTLLEVRTIVHTLCTLVTYALWWNKPFKVARPIVIPLKDVLEWRQNQPLQWGEFERECIPRCPFPFATNRSQHSILNTNLPLPVYVFFKVVLSAIYGPSHCSMEYLLSYANRATSLAFSGNHSRCLGRMCSNNVRLRVTV